MRKRLFVTILLCLILAGCDGVRFAPSETEKQNAWLHLRTAQLAAEKAKAEDSSQQLQQLTGLSSVQSEAFASYYGMPKELSQSRTAEDVLSASSWQIAESALRQSGQRPDAWQLADSALELAIGVAALLGGVYGTKAARFLNQARNRSKALREIIAGNELFKGQNQDAAGAFKQAHSRQSPQTRQLVAAMKA